MTVGLVSVLFVRVSVVALPTNVSVLVGSVNVPVLLMLEIIGAVNVLFVRVWVAAIPATVSVTAGRDSTLFPAVAGACSVTDPLVSPAITIELIMYPYKTTQREPVETVTDCPEATVIGPDDIPDVPDAMV